MSRINLYASFFLLLILDRCAYSQSPQIDSLKQVVRTPGTDTNYVKNLLNLSWKLRNVGQNDSCLAYCKKAERVALQQNFKKLLGKSLTISGIAFMDKGAYDSAQNYYMASLKVRQEINDKKGIAACYNNLGNLFEARGNLPQALRMQLMALQIREEIKEKKDMAASYNNIGNIYMGMGDNEQALKNFFTSLKIKEELGDQLGVGMSYNSIGLMCEARKEHQKALEYYNKCLAIEKEAGYLLGIGDCYSNIGEVYQRLAKQQTETTERAKLQKEAFLNYEHSLQIREEISDKQGITTSFNNLAAVLSEMGQFKSSESYALRSLKLAKELNDLDLLKDIHKNLSEVYTALGRHIDALAHYKLSIAARDSLTNEANTKKTVQLEMQYEFDKKEAATKLEQEKKEAIASAEKKKQRIVLFAISGFGLLVLCFAIFAYRSFLQKQKANIEITKQKEIIEEKQLEILDSIYYARRIQRSLLTSERYIRRNLDKFLKG